MRNLARLCEEMGITVIAEGIETPAERDFVADCGIRLMQGYLFAKPALRAMAPLREEAFAPARCAALRACFRGCGTRLPASPERP